MAKVIQDVTLEVIKPNRFQAIVAKQYDDDSRFLKVTFVNNGEKIEIQKTSTAVINANRIDGESKSFMGETNDDGTATLPLNFWMLSLEGNLYCDVTIIDAEGRKLTSTSFTVLVEKSASGQISDDPGSDEYTLLFEATTAAREAAELATAAADNVMKKDQVASVLDVVKKTPIYIGSGTDEQINELENLVPGTTIYFDETDTSWEDLNQKVDDLGAEVDDVKTAVDGKAPAGYGLGSAQKVALSELDNFYSPGWFYVDEPSTTIGGFTANYWFGYTEALGEGASHSVQHIRAIKEGITNKLTRRHYNGEWGELEWESPPMEPGVEYRTTERWSGKVVYTQLINCGALPNAESKSVTTTIPATANIVFVAGVAINSNGQSEAMPCVDYTGKVTCTFFVTAGRNISFNTFYNLSDWTAYVTVKYTKD